MDLDEAVSYKGNFDADVAAKCKLINNLLVEIYKCQSLTMLL